MKKLVMILLATICTFFVMAFTACEINKGNTLTVTSIEKAASNGLEDTYTITYSDGSTGTFTITNGKDGEQGIKGEQGEKGEDGHSPKVAIGANGNWFVDDKDTGIKAVGRDGEKGDRGEQGDKGDKGEQGKDGQNGENGKSAYEIYKEKYGYEGTEEEWLVDLANGRLDLKEKHTVIFDTVGGTVIPEQKVIDGKKIVKPEDPIKEGYRFTGWYCGEELWSFIGYTVTEDMNLTAKWEKVTIVGNFEIEEDSYITIKSYVGEGNMTIPYLINGKEVVIGDNAFEGNNKIKAVTFETDFVNYRKEMFKKCNNIQKIIFNDKYNNELYWLFGYTTATVPESLTEISYLAETGINKEMLKSELAKHTVTLVIPEGVSSIGGFDSCIGIEEVRIPGTVTTIEESAFSGCVILNDITIPDSVTSLGKYCFSNCVKFKNITIPKGISNIGDGAFAGCTGISNISISDNVTTIGGSAFAGCLGLEEIIIPDSVAGECKWLFSDCTKLKKVYLSKNIKAVYFNCFRNCESLSSVIFGYSGSWTVIGCEAIGVRQAASSSFENANGCKFLLNNNNNGQYMFHS